MMRGYLEGGLIFTDLVKRNQWGEGKERKKNAMNTKTMMNTNYKGIDTCHFFYRGLSTRYHLSHNEVPNKEQL
jgi:hypothetical protein